MHAVTGKHSKLLVAMNDPEGEWDTLQRVFVFVTIPRIWEVFIQDFDKARGSPDNIKKKCFLRLLCQAQLHYQLQTGWSELK